MFFKSVASITAWVFIGFIAFVWTFVVMYFFKDMNFFQGWTENPLFLVICFSIGYFLAIASIWIMLIIGALIMGFLGWLIHGNIPELSEEEKEIIEKKEREKEVDSLAHFMQDINRNDN